MSDWGTFVTERTCRACIQALHELCEQHPDVRSYVIGDDSSRFAALAGTLTTTAMGCEHLVFLELPLNIEDFICHPLRILILHEDGTWTTADFAPHSRPRHEVNHGSKEEGLPAAERAGTEAAETA